jgi:hypothetical protein
MNDQSQTNIDPPSPYSYKPPPSEASLPVTLRPKMGDPNTDLED